MPRQEQHERLGPGLLRAGLQRPHVGSAESSGVGGYTADWTRAANRSAVIYPAPSTASLAESRPGTFTRKWSGGIARVDRSSESKPEGMLGFEGLA